MSSIAIGVTIGTPDVAGQVPVTDTNIGASLASASTYLATTTTDLATLTTAVNTVTADCATTSTDAVNADNDCTALVAYMGTVGLTGSLSASVTLTAAQGNSLIAAAALVSTDTGATRTAAATAATAASAVPAVVTAVSADVANVTTQVTNSQSASSDHVFIQMDTAHVTSVSLMNGALLAALNFALDAGILPP